MAKGFKDSTRTQRGEFNFARTSTPVKPHSRTLPVKKAQGGRVTADGYDTDRARYVQDADYKESLGKSEAEQARLNDGPRRKSLEKYHGKDGVDFNVGLLRSEAKRDLGEAKRLRTDKPIKQMTPERMKAYGFSKGGAVRSGGKTVSTGKPRPKVRNGGVPC